MSSSSPITGARTSSRSKTDDRLQRATPLQRLFRRPRSGSLLGLVIVLGLFVFIAVGACLLMVAGEFDLSMGSMIAFSGMAMALLIKFGGFAPWLAILSGFALALAVGYCIGVLRVRTGLPSFIVSLAFLFILRGVTIVAARMFNETTLIGGMQSVKQDDSLAAPFVR